MIDTTIIVNLAMSIPQLLKHIITKKFTLVSVDVIPDPRSTVSNKLILTVPNDVLLLT